jgi:indolepyruvate ferredoxin oxidoreductase alpha subunit
MKKPDDLFQFMLLPAIARKKYKHLISLQGAFQEEAMKSDFNSFNMQAPDTSLGIIATGLAFNYLMDVYQGQPVPHPVLKICQYPLPERAVRELYDKCDALLVLEEGMPLVEDMIKGLAFSGSKPIKGRLDGTIDREES